LQILPELPPDARTAAAATYLDGAARDLDAAARADLLRQVEGVLTAPACRELFGPDSRAEVSLAGRFGPLVVGGQVDRLVVGPDAIVIADYKTGRSPPSRAEDVHASYRRQMAAYRAVLRQIYPGRPISCVLVWTETASVMPLPDDCLDDEDPACVDA
jgi:ATP-dependent helicase/nuclease subunit A